MNRSYKNLESIKSIIIEFPVVSDNRNDYKRVHKIKINQDIIIDSLTLENLFFIITKKNLFLWIFTKYSHTSIQEPCREHSDFFLKMFLHRGVLI